MPYQKGKPLHCERYAFNSTNHDGSHWKSECKKDDFDSSNILRCNKFIYRTDEISVLNEVPIPNWVQSIPKKLTLISFLFDFKNAHFHIFALFFSIDRNLVWFRM